MNDMLEHRSITDELSIAFHFTDGEKFTQTLPIDCADAAQDVMEWFKDKKGTPVWTWLHPHSSKVQMIPRSQVVFIEITGFIAIEGKDSKWYQRVMDKFRALRMLRRMKGGVPVGEDSKTFAKS